MSTLAYAQLTNRRDFAQPTKSSTTSPGTATFTDALSALVPAEVLSLHAVIISLTTTITSDSDKVTRINYPQTLFWTFWVLIILSAILFIVPRLIGGRWDNWDYIRTLIPPLAFVGWAMLQRTTAFDAVLPSLDAAPRTVIAIIGAVILGLISGVLADQADKKPAPPRGP